MLQILQNKKGCENMKDIYNHWLEYTKENDEIYNELASIKDDDAAIEDRFYRELEFGTGGLRGVIGAGTNRMNVYTVGKAAQGCSNYLLKHYQNPSVAIGYDSRIHSDLFAETAASIYASNGIKVYIYPKLMPTPSVSFAIRDLKCQGGVVVTASHNPAKYNGYKVYGSDGCQITTEAAKEIQAEINNVDTFKDVKKGDFKSLLEQGKISYIGDDTVQRYFDEIAKVSVLPKDISRDVSIVYTPLNGAGISCVPDCLKQHGFNNITIPDEQKNPDGNFPTCPYPNPEIREALNVGLEWAEKTKSDLLLATDPDCDRVGVAVKDKDEYKLITGNEMGVLLLDFICKMRIKSKTMPENPIAVKTIVTTPMAAKVAQHYNVELIDVLTGFKFIGEQIGLLEKVGQENRYIFGFEESYGYLSGSFVRDKDAVNASLLICEMFAYYKSQGQSLLDVLSELYKTYGFYQSKLLTFTFEGSAGFAKMQDLMNGVRNNKPDEIAGYKVLAVADYQNSTMVKFNGEKENINLPKSNVIRFFLDNDLEAVIRPSGTEPKLKVYVTAIGDTLENSNLIAEKLANYFSDLTNI